MDFGFRILDWILDFGFRINNGFWILFQNSCFLDKIVDSRQYICSESAVSRAPQSARLVRPYILKTKMFLLNSDHVGRSVHTKAYWKVKDFVHGEPLHRPLQKCRNFMIFYVFFENFMVFFRLDGTNLFK